MAEQLDEKLQVKVLCAGIIVCGVVSIAVLMSIFLNQILNETVDREDITNLIFYVVVSTFSIAVIICAYRIERGSKAAWIICTCLELLGVLVEVLTFTLAATTFISLITSMTSLGLLMSRTLRNNCGIEIGKKRNSEDR